MGPGCHRLVHCHVYISCGRCWSILVHLKHGIGCYRIFLGSGTQQCVWGRWQQCA